MRWYLLALVGLAACSSTKHANDCKFIYQETELGELPLQTNDDRVLPPGGALELVNGSDSELVVEEKNGGTLGELATTTGYQIYVAPTTPGVYHIVNDACGFVLTIHVAAPGFDAPMNVAGVLPSPAATVVGDFDGDGKPDVAVVGTSGTQVFKGDGAGGLTPTMTVPVGGSSVAAGQDPSGNPSLVVTNPSASPQVTFVDPNSGATTPAPMIDSVIGLLNKGIITDDGLYARGSGAGSGDMGAPMAPTGSLHKRRPPHRLILGGSKGMAIMVFGMPMASPAAVAVPNVISAVTSDVDGDGLVDAVGVTQQSDGSAQGFVALGKADGTLGPVTMLDSKPSTSVFGVVEVDTGFSPFSVVGVETNNIGAATFLSDNSTSSPPQLFANQFSGALPAPPASLDKAFLDDSGFPVVAATGGNASGGLQVTFLQPVSSASGGPMFQAAGSVNVASPGVATLGGIAFGDLNGDGIDDLIIADTSDGTLELLLSVSPIGATVADMAGPTLKDMSSRGAVDMTMSMQMDAGVCQCRATGQSCEGNGFPPEFATCCDPMAECHFGVCKEGPGGPCASIADCMEGELCTNSTCVSCVVPLNEMVSCNGSQPCCTGCGTNHYCNYVAPQALGASCTADFNCNLTGGSPVCRKAGSAGNVCCAVVGTSCTMNSDCCGNQLCMGGTCTGQPIGGPCTTGEDCYQSNQSNGWCDNNVCTAGAVCAS